MRGWKYEWIGELPLDVYDVLLALVNDSKDEDDRLID